MVTYDRYDIVFQEIPNEVSLAFTIEGCPNNCNGCHSPHLMKQNGRELTQEELVHIMSQYKDTFTCVLFLGGDAFHDDLYKLFKLVKMLGYKSAFYSGNDDINGKFVPVLDYYKIGQYNKEVGGLSNKNTNQKLYNILDITEEFWT